MFDAIRHDAPATQDSFSAAAVKPAPATSARDIQQQLRDAPCASRADVARGLVDNFDDAALTGLAADPDGRDALQSLDDALADTPEWVADVTPQRERITDALREVNGGDTGTEIDPDQPDGSTAAGVTQTTEHIGSNTVTWTNDSEGRPIRAEADLSEVFSGIDRSSAETRAQGESADRGVEGDQGGHLIGHRFVQDQGLKNLFPQEANFNVSAYKKLENEWADWIDSGREVRIDVSLTPVDQDRPDQVRLSYEVIDPADGRVVYDQRVTFRNEAGQQFDRFAHADMANA